MQDFYFLVKFGLALIFILKVYRKKSSSILLRKKMFNLLLAFFFLKFSQVFFSRFLYWKSRNYSFLSKFSSEIYLPGIIIGVVFLPCISSVWGAVIFFVLYPHFLSFLFYFSIGIFLEITHFTLTFHRIAGKEEGIIIFQLPPAHEHSFNSSRFLPLLFNWSICNCQTCSWWDLFSIDLCILCAFLLMQ